MLTLLITFERIAQYRTENDPEIRLKEAESKIDKILDSNSAYPALLNIHQAISINEFTNGILMCDALPDQFKTFAIDLMRQLQRDYNCQTAGEKATAELVAINFVQILDLKQQMARSLATHNALFYAHQPHPKNSFYGELAGRCIACERSKVELENRKLLSKEIERVTRYYLAAIQTLRMMKQAPLQVNINTNIGKNQVIQTKNG